MKLTIAKHQSNRFLIRHPSIRIFLAFTGVCRGFVRRGQVRIMLTGTLSSVRSSSNVTTIRLSARLFSRQNSAAARVSSKSKASCSFGVYVRGFLK